MSDDARREAQLPSTSLEESSDDPSAFSSPNNQNIPNEDERGERPRGHSRSACSDAEKDIKMEEEDEDDIGQREDRSNKKKGRKQKKKKDTKEKEEDAESDEVYVSEEGQIYCVCRSTDTSRFMICCDQCAEWYHGDCMQVTRTQAKHIEKYFCPECVSKDGTLVIIYTEKYLKAKAKKEEQASLAAVVAAIKQEEAAAAVAAARAESPPLRCGGCIGCFRTADCGRCEGCIAQKPCLKRACVQADVLAKQKNNTQKTMASRVREKRKMKEISSDEDDLYVPVPQPLPIVSPEKGKRGRKKGWRKDGSHMLKPSAVVAEKSSVTTTAIGDSGDRKAIDQAADDAWRNPLPMEARVASARLSYLSYSQSTGRRRTKQTAKEDVLHCLGIGCVQAARINSKYCSDECGLRLAEERLRDLLKSRAQDFWAHEPVAKKRAENSDLSLQAEQEQLMEEKRKLGEWMTYLLRYIQALKDIKPVEDDEDEGPDMVVSCSVCAVEYPAKQLAKHVERCFVKLEKQVTFGTTLANTANPDNLFCDEFNKVNKTYCKRLRVMCPEHYKGDVEAGVEVCGCPKKWSGIASYQMLELFAAGGGFAEQTCCLQSRKNCAQHHRWIQTMLGHLESMRHRILSRWDELIELRRNIMLNRQHRGDAFLLMSNKTKYHVPMEKILKTAGDGISASP